MRFHLLHRRCTAAMLTALWLLLPVLPALHATHAHSFCAEHGTFEEGADGSATRDDEATWEGREGVLSSAAAAHHRCSVFPVPLLHPVASRFDVVHAAALAAPPALRPAVVDVRPQQSVLARAPKASPPSA